MAAPAPGRTLDIMVSHMEVTGTLKAFISLKHPFLQAGGHGKYLGRRTRFIGIADAEIPPYLVPRHLLPVGNHIFPGKMLQHLVLGNDRAVIFPPVHSHCLLFPQVKQILLRIAGYVPGIIQIEFIAGSHGQNLPVVGIHDNGSRDLASHIGLPLVNIFLDNVLDVYINGRDHSIAAHGRLHHALQIRILVQVSVFTSVYPDQAAVIILLNASGAHASVAASKAYDIAGQGIIGINTLVFILKPDTLNPLPGIRVVIAPAVGFICLFCHLFKGHPLVIGELASLIVSEIGRFPPLLNQGPQFPRVKTKVGDQGLYRGFQIVFRVRHDLARINDQIVNLLAGSQIGAVPVHNVSPAVRDDTAVILLLALGEHDFIVLLVVVLYDPVQNHD